MAALCYFAIVQGSDCRCSVTKIECGNNPATLAAAAASRSFPISEKVVAACRGVNLKLDREFDPAVRQALDMLTPRL
jgi:hypothetical protein